MTSARSFFPVAVGSIAFLFACTVLSPHILQRLDRTVLFQGIEIMGIDAEHYYAARVEEASEDGWSIGNAYYAEYKNVPALQPALPEWIIATCGRRTGITPVQAFVLSKGVFAFLLVIVLTGFLSSVSRRPWVALIAVTALVFAESAFSAPWDVSLLLQGIVRTDFLRFARPINPQWPDLLFFSVLWLVSLWMERRRRVLMVGAAALTALLLYSYVYAWTYIGVSVFLLSIWLLYKRDLKRLSDVLVFSLVIAVLGIPYLVNMWQLVHHPWYPDAAMRQGLVHKRAIVLGAWPMLFLILAVLSRRLWLNTAPLLIALAVGGIIVLNQQVITGLYLVPHHYHWYFIQPLGVCLFVLGVGVLVHRYVRSKRLCRLLGASVMCVAILFGVHQQYAAYIRQAAGWEQRQELMPVLTFIRDHLDPDTVIYSSDKTYLRDAIAMYTSSDVFVHQYANLFLLPTTRARDSWFFDLWISGFTPDDAARRFSTDMRTDLSSNLFAIYYRELTGRFDAFPDDLVAQNIALYKQYYDLPLMVKLHRYRFDDIVVTPKDVLTPQWKMILVDGKVLYDRDGYRVVALGR